MKRIILGAVLVSFSGCYRLMSGLEVADANRPQPCAMKLRPAGPRRAGCAWRQWAKDRSADHPRPSDSRYATKESLRGAQRAMENVTVPAGTFSARHLVFGSGASEPFSRPRCRARW